MVSNICEAFGCLPDEAERQNWQRVQAILEYRMAKEAVEMFNDKEKGAEWLNEHARHRDLLFEIQQAQGSE